jgi:hypothetical protein
MRAWVATTSCRPTASSSAALLPRNRRKLNGRSGSFPSRVATCRAPPDFSVSAGCSAAVRQGTGDPSNRGSEPSEGRTGRTRARAHLCKRKPDALLTIDANELVPLLHGNRSQLGGRVVLDLHHVNVLERQVSRKLDARRSFDLDLEETSVGATLCRRTLLIQRVGGCQLLLLLLLLGLISKGGVEIRRC